MSLNLTRRNVRAWLLLTSLVAVLAGGGEPWLIRLESGQQALTCES